MYSPFDRVDVLDQGSIQLVQMMPVFQAETSDSLSSVDLAVVEAARTSLDPDIRSKGKTQDTNLIRYLIKHGHTSPFEMVEFKFFVNAPLVVWWQWVRHRTASYNFQSGRYTAFKEDAFYVPSKWRLQDPKNKQGSSDEVLNDSDSQFLSRALLDHYAASFSLYTLALQKGVAKELARTFLPGFAVYYKAFVKQDMHNLSHYCKLRFSSEAQTEIFEYARVIWDIIKFVAPVSAQAFEEKWAQENK